MEASNGLEMVERMEVRLRARTGHGGEKIVMVRIWRSAQDGERVGGLGRATEDKLVRRFGLDTTDASNKGTGARWRLGRRGKIAFCDGAMTTAVTGYLGGGEGIRKSVRGGSGGAGVKNVVPTIVAASGGFEHGLM